MKNIYYLQKKYIESEKVKSKYQNLEKKCNELEKDNQRLISFKGKYINLEKNFEKIEETLNNYKISKGENLNESDNESEEKDFSKIINEINYILNELMK